MSSQPSTEEPPSPYSVYHELSRHDCTCFPMGFLAEFPFLRTIVDNESQIYVAHLITLACQRLYSVYSLLPGFLRRPLYVLLIQIDSVCLLMVCYTERICSWAAEHIWGRGRQAPKASCECFSRSLL